MFKNMQMSIISQESKFSTKHVDITLIKVDLHLEKLQ